MLHQAACIAKLILSAATLYSPQISVTQSASLNVNQQQGGARSPIARST